MSNFHGRDFLTLMDFSKEDILCFLETAAELKRKRRRREPHDYLRGYSVGMLFEKKSTRTRVSFQAGMAQLGIQSFYLRPDELQLGRGEPISDTARVIDRYCDALFIRTYGQEIVEEFARWMANPVINALTNLVHPCQGLADLLTIQEKKNRLEGLKLAYVGDVYNVAHSLIIAGATFGFDVYVAGPEKYRPAGRVVDCARERAQTTGGRLVLTSDLEEALDGADVVYANTFHSMGVDDIEQRVREYRDYQVNERTLALAKSDAIFMHCLPGYRGEEMTEEVIEGPQSAVWDQAENRMHTEKAVLVLTLL
ncbi:MAG: ornithine carbamoyltransferase [Bacillota bacterium]